MQEEAASEVPCAGRLVTMTSDGLTLSSEALDFGEEDRGGEEEEEEDEDLKPPIIDVKEIIEVEEDLVPYQEEEEDERKQELEGEEATYLVSFSRRAGFIGF